MTPPSKALATRRTVVGALALAVLLRPLIAAAAIGSPQEFIQELGNRTLAVLGQAVTPPEKLSQLKQLLDQDAALGFSEEGRVLWLDGLSRHIEALDDRVLEGLAAAGVPVVATAREETWRRMLASEAEDGERARRAVDTDPFLHEGLLEAHWLKQWTPQ